MRATMWTDTHTYNQTCEHKADYCKDLHTPNHMWSCTPYQRVIWSFSYSYLHVYESQRIPGMQIYLNSDRICKYPPSKRQGERGGWAVGWGGRPVYLFEWHCLNWSLTLFTTLTFMQMWKHLYVMDRIQLTEMTENNLVNWIHHAVESNIIILVGKGWMGGVGGVSGRETGREKEGEREEGVEEWEGGHKGSRR